MSIDYKATIVYGIPFEGLYEPVDGDGYDWDAYWDAFGEFVWRTDAYNYSGTSIGVIGEMVANTDTYEALDFASVRLTHTDDEIREAYGVVTGKVTQEEPRMYLVHRVF